MLKKLSFPLFLAVLGLGLAFSLDRFTFGIFSFLALAAFLLTFFFNLFSFDFVNFFKKFETRPVFAFSFFFLFSFFALAFGRFGSQFLF